MLYVYYEIQSKVNLFCKLCEIMQILDCLKEFWEETVLLKRSVKSKPRAFHFSVAKELCVIKEGLTFTSE